MCYFCIQDKKNDKKCNFRRCHYITGYPYKYFEHTKNKKIKDSECDLRHCYYYNYPYKYILDVYMTEH